MQWGSDQTMQIPETSDASVARCVLDVDAEFPIERNEHAYERLEIRFQCVLIDRYTGEIQNPCRPTDIPIRPIPGAAHTHAELGSFFHIDWNTEQGLVIEPAKEIADRSLYVVELRPCAVELYYHPETPGNAETIKVGESITFDEAVELMHDGQYGWKPKKMLRTTGYISGGDPQDRPTTDKIFRSESEADATSETYSLASTSQTFAINAEGSSNFEVSNVDT